MKEGKITDETRIRAALPTIQYLVEQGAKVILASHLGRPKGQVVEEMRLTPVAARLGELLGKDVKKRTKIRTSCTRNGCSNERRRRISS